MKFVLIKNTLQNNIWWWEYDEKYDRLYNAQGGWHPWNSETEEILEWEEHAEDFDELDWEKTTLIQPDSELGWLDPQGKFYGCKYGNHDLLADLHLRSSVKDLEKDGWLRIVRVEGEMRYYLTGSNIRITSRPKRWLFDQGIHIDEEDD